MEATERGDELLARALLPVLAERIGDSVARLRALRERSLEVPGEAAERELAAAADEVQALGWLLGWISSGLGAQLLQERHEPRALDWALRLVDGALRREGRLLSPGTMPLPLVTPKGGWRLAWAAAGLVLRAANELPEGAALTFDVLADGDGAKLAGPGRAGSAWEQHAGALERDLQGTRLESAADPWIWSFPAGWVEVRP